MTDPKGTLLYETLERLLALPATDLEVALSNACDVVASILRADKVDAFLYDPTRDSLIAVGNSNQPLTALQRRLGLDLMQVANGGRAVQVWQTGQTFVSGRVDLDPEEIRGVKEGLKVRSELGVPLIVGGARRGLVLVCSLEPDAYTPEDVRLAESIAGWVSIVVHRAELVEEIARNAVEQGRRAVAEELITVLAHDLRNYISPVLLRLEVLRRRAQGEERAADIRDLDLASRGLHRLSGIVSDILDVARIDQGVFRMEIMPVDLVALLEDVSHTLSAPDRPVCTKAAEDVIVVADPARLRQCVENLISNAVKHSPKGATVTVRVAREQHEEGEFARVEVLDEGPGIAPEFVPRIFERFTTGGRTGSGLGLGLYLAQRIAVMHRGRLTVESAPGKGACFTLELPCSQEP